MRRRAAGTGTDRRTAVGLVLVGLMVVVSAAGLLLREEALDQDLGRRLERPRSAAPLGTDALGRDLLARVAAAGAVSLTLSAACVLASLGIGLVLGLAAGQREGGIGDRLLLRLVDLTMAFPGLLLAVLVAGLLGGGPLVIVCALVLTGWTDFFRLSRSLTVTLVSAPYVEAGRLAGFPIPFLLRRYILPEVAPQLLTLATLGMGKTILGISSLGFLGIGISPPDPEWGAMIAEGLPVMRQAPHVIVAPAVAVFATILGFYLLGQGLARHREWTEEAR